MNYAFSGTGESVRSTIVAVVQDIDKTADFYSRAFGLGPFHRAEVDSPSASWNGKPAPARFRTAAAPLGPCEMELIEVVGGRPPHAEFLDRFGEGMNHLNLDYRDAESYLGRMLVLHREGVHYFWGFPHSGFCYVHSEDIGGITFEVMRGSGHAGKKGHNHLGLVVADTDRAVSYYRDVVGFPEFRTNTFPMKDATYEDRRIDAAFRASFTDLGEGRLMLVQPVAGESPFAEFLETSGEGMHHLRLEEPDGPERRRRLRENGISEVWTSPEWGAALMDTRAVGGMPIALAMG